MSDLSVYAQAKLLAKLLNPTDPFFDYVDAEHGGLRVDAYYELAEDEMQIVAMLTDADQ